MITLTLSGLCGKMGRMIAAYASEDPDISIVSGIESTGHPLIGKRLSEILGDDSLNGELYSDIEDAGHMGDVLIDFSHHQTTIPLMKKAAQYGKAMVIGTTGFSPEEERQIQDLSGTLSCVKSPNMSIGMNLLFNLVECAARTIGDSYDIEIVEAHHRFKKDAPSGTARKLLEIAAEASGKNSNEDAVYGREGMIGERKQSEIGVFAVRGGDIVGDHTVLFAGLGERLELSHQAHTRATFARGAIRAAKYIVAQKNGLYDMQDVLGLK